MTEIMEGCELYLPKERYRNAQTVTVTKVGRKWLTLSNGERADKETLVLDQNHGSAPKLYQSEAAWQKEMGHNRLWGAFRSQVERTAHSRPPASEEAIRKAAALLGLPLNVVKES